MNSDAAMTPVAFRPFALSVSIVVYAIAEASWLYLTNPFYARQFALFTTKPLAIRSVVAAVAVYAVIAVTFWALVVRHIGRQLPWKDAAVRGATFGLAVYGVYNLTNKATLPGYSWTMVGVDTAWGTAMFAALAGVYSWAL